jgi:hypothetical protein
MHGKWTNSVLAEPRLAGLNFKFKDQFNRHKKTDLVPFFMPILSGLRMLRISILKLKLVVLRKIINLFFSIMMALAEASK